jgi:hypothetical protein
MRRTRLKIHGQIQRMNRKYAAPFSSAMPSVNLHVLVPYCFPCYPSCATSIFTYEVQTIVFNLVQQRRDLVAGTGSSGSAYIGRIAKQYLMLKQRGVSFRDEKPRVQSQEGAISLEKRR